VAGDLRHHGKEGAVAHHGDAADAPMVVAHEADVRHQRGEVVPTGNLRGLDHQPGEVAMLLDEGIDLLADPFEIGRLQGALGVNHEDALVDEQFVPQHAGPSFRAV
jgi:hypothetical protein